VIAWALACWLGRLPVVVLPPPDKVLIAFVGNMGLLLEESWVTLRETLYGFALALVLGLPMAVAVATSRTL
jgi:NitT/TauT family transport system permease protein